MPSSLHTWVTENVSSALHNYLGEQRTALQTQAPELGELVTMLENFLVGGKFLRPHFVAVGALAVGPQALEENKQSLSLLGAAVELVQAAALIHDDLIDHSDTRRGRPAVHKASEAAHARAELSGSSQDFGAATAVVLGDFALTISEQLAARALAGHHDRGHFDALRSEMMAGQYLDILNQARGLSSPESPEEAAMTVIRWKTVPYTVLRPLLLGATHAGASASACEALQTLAVPLGTAFQLRDDLLGVFGDEKATGKPASGDITEGKRTTLLAFAQDHASTAQHAVLDAAVGRPEATVDEVSAARQVFEETGARQHVEQQVTTLAELTRSILDTQVRATAHPDAVAELDALTTRATGIGRDV